MDCVPEHLLAGVVPSAAALFTRENCAIFTRAHVIAMSRQIISEIADLTGIQFDISPEIIPGWVDADHLSQRTRYNEPARLRFAAAGRLGQDKGTHLIIEACAELVAKGHAGFSVDVFCLGGTSPDPWIAMATQRGVASCISWRSGVAHSKLLSLLPEYDAFLFPTQTREPFGFTPIEAAACGLVPIITRNAGVAERLVNGVHALKIDRTPSSLAAAMHQLLNNELDIAAMGRRASRLVREDLGFSRCLDEIERVLRGSAKAWDQRRIDEPRLPVILYAKHVLGMHLTAHP
jgi:glycosyltransferase involved in cell wall biosynthesis